VLIIITFPILTAAEAPVSLPPGTKIGSYEIIGLLGAGGMGEVYRARDPHLGRDVAIKVLPPGFGGDPARVRRFEREARAAGSLNHPNLISVHEVGSHEGMPYLVMELLEGETLRARIGGRALPVRRAVEIGQALAQGLAAAHEKGILHRDLKPENIFLTRDGRVKILDFGLAKTHAPMAGTLPGNLTTDTLDPGHTETGVVLGTAGYMSPEQVRGEPLDGRSDLFALGMVLWEMLTGSAPFHRPTRLETLAAILREDPPALDPALGVPPALEHILQGCLAKDPAARFHSAHDLAFALAECASPRVPPRAGGRGRTALIGGLLGAAGLALATLLAWMVQWPPFRPAAPPRYTRLTYREGRIPSARFTPDGLGVLLSGDWERSGERAPYHLFSLKLNPLELVPAGLEDALVLAVSPNGEVALATGVRFNGMSGFYGTLGLARMGALAPKGIQPGVFSADLAADGRVALSRDTPKGVFQLECPPGTVRLEGPAELGDLRFSPDGHFLAFVQHTIRTDTLGRVAVLDLATGRAATLSRKFTSLTGLAWRDREIWFTGAVRGARKDLWAVTLAGRERLVLRSPADLTLMDLRPDGQVLLAREEVEGRMYLSTGDPAPPRDLTAGFYPIPLSLADNGSCFLYWDQTDNPTGAMELLLQPVPGGPPMRIGRSFSFAALAPDGSRVLTFPEDPFHPVIMPIGTGEPRPLPTELVRGYSRFNRWTQDGKGLVVFGALPGGTPRTWLQDAETGALRPLGPEGTEEAWPAPNGRRLLARIRGHWALLETGAPEGPQTSVPGLDPLDRILGWTPDSRWLRISRRTSGAVLAYRFDPAKGRRELWKRFEMPDIRMNLGRANPTFLTPDGRLLLASNLTWNSTLFLVDGLR